jgi:murein DD-endopeptidase MepM/ murein hydrolase activator NlpD
MHKKVLSGVFIFFVFSFGLNFISRGYAQSATPTTGDELTRQQLEAQIDSKSKELAAINQQLTSTNQNLKATQNQKATLQKELATLQNSMANLTLHIKSDELNIQKLSLEIDSLNYDMRDIEISSNNKKEAVVEILKQLQQQDQRPLLAKLLTHASLADEVLELQAFTNLQGQLSRDIASLKDLHDQYAQKVTLSNKKKQEASVHRQDLQNKKAIVQDQQIERANILKDTKNKESIYQQQLSELKKKQQQIANEIESLDSVLRTKIDPASLPSLHTGALGMPLNGDRSDVTQGYGSTDFAKSGYAGHWHNGLDFGASIGTPIYAAEEGTVSGVGNTDSYCPRGSYGKYIAINHTNNLTTLYSHLSRQIVTVGDKVTRGQIIGYSGKTGYATGPHLHFTVYAKSTFYIGPSRTCGPQPYGGDLNPSGYLW